MADEIQEDLANIRAGSCQYITPLEQGLHQRVAEVAYEYAKERDFVPGKELDDWLAAEERVAAEIKSMLPEAMANLPTVMPQTAQSTQPV